MCVSCKVTVAVHGAAVAEGNAAWQIPVRDDAFSATRRARRWVGPPSATPLRSSEETFAVIIVTGTKRSGTSMWMQVLASAGIPVLGDAFPRTWGQTIREANPSGFYESRFRKGMYWATNPDPRTGVFLHPDEVADHAVKIFAPGLVRTDFAYIGPVVVTVRRCREYVASLRRLYALEDQGIQALRGRAREPRVRMPPELEWWVDNWMIVRDVVTRRHDARYLTYDRVLRDPVGACTSVCAWLGAPDPGAGSAAIQTSHRTQQHLDALGIEHEDVFDELYHRLDHDAALDRAFLRELSALHESLLPAIRRHRAAVRADVRRKATREAPSVTDGLLRFDDDWSGETEPGS
jgi:hypothetical protein